MFVFFFKQKTAYEMRISDWSSDVCSSDLAAADTAGGRVLLALPPAEVLRLGLISNRGMIVVGGAAVAISQLNPQLPDDVSDRWTATAQAFFGSHHFSFGEYALRSEEHTSELQSLMRTSYAVFCLKKK